MCISIGTIFQKIRIELQPVSEELSTQDAETIIEHILKMSRSDLYLNFNLQLTIKQKSMIELLVKKRLTGIPISYVTSTAFFYNKEFTITPDVLIPRPDTECLISIILKGEKKEYASFIEIGTGSGIIAETLADERNGWHGIALDISQTALSIAQRNCSHSINIVCCDKFTAIKKLPGFDFIVSNPPYISQKEMRDLDRSVLDFEPHLALYGRNNGLEFYYYIAKNGMALLADDGHVYLEIGADQGKDVSDIFLSTGWENIEIFIDLGKRPRVIKAKKTKKV